MDLLKFKLTDQTAIGVPNSTPWTAFASDDTVMKLNDKLYSWYMQALPIVQDPENKKIYDTVVSVVNRNRATHEKQKEMANDIVKRVEAILASKKESGDDAARKVATSVTNALKMSPLPTKLDVTDGKASDRDSKGGGMHGGNRFEDFVKDWKAQQTDQAGKEKKAEELLLRYENDPVLSPDNEKITSTDRIVFIAMTFVLRAVSLYLVEWAVNTYMVKEFTGAFKLYLVCYLSLFTLWALLVNSSDNLFFKMLFYYISTDPHGMGRIIVHFLIQMLILPVPLIVKAKGFDNTEEEYTYEKRRKALSILNYFTFFLWAITSLVAIKY